MIQYPEAVRFYRHRRGVLDLGITSFVARRRAQSPKTTNSLTLRKPSWATNGQTAAFGNAHDLP
jgi:hypothetical protein